MPVPGKSWTNIIALEAIDTTLPINAANNTLLYTLPVFGSGISEGLTLVPSAYTVQIMNANALQTTSGVLYAGVLNMQGIQAGSTGSYDSFAGEFISFQAPKLLAAPRLALRGVKANGYPLNMSELANFTAIQPVTTPSFIVTYGPDQPTAAGFTPLVVYNPSGVKLEFLVTVEFRVRFDLTNPASAGHTYHPISSDTTWDRLTRKAASMGHGIRDLSETVAAVGKAALTVGELMA